MKKADDLIVSVSDARGILGKAATSLSDEEVRIIITVMDQMAVLLVDMYKVQKSTQSD